MKRVLLTGMSGTGKSSVVRELVARGEEFRRFLEDVETVEPLLRRVADHEVRTTAPLDEVVATVLRLVDA